MLAAHATILASPTAPRTGPGELLAGGVTYDFGEPGTGADVYAPVLGDPIRRGLHDRAAGTVVVCSAEGH